jgi:RimJ/RimL family protein N-acetyltransferase
MESIQKLKQGYAHLLDAPVAAFESSGLTFIETGRRELPEWANWVIPLWLLDLGPAVICSVAPPYAAVAKTLVESLKANTLLSPEMAHRARQLINAEGWQQREILFFPGQDPPPIFSPAHIWPYPVEKLKPGAAGDALLKAFDGTVFVIRNWEEQIVAHAGIKNKGILREIAISVESVYRCKGMGTAVVAEAVTEILAEEKVPVFIPDRLTNTASYALARSLGFAKVGEMLFWEYEQPGWEGF